MTKSKTKERGLNKYNPLFKDLTPEEQLESGMTDTFTAAEENFQMEDLPPSSPDALFSSEEDEDLTEYEIKENTELHFNDYFGLRKFFTRKRFSHFNSRPPSRAFA